MSAISQSAASDERRYFPAHDGPEKRGGATRMVWGSDLRENDILFFLTSPHRITHFEDYSHPSITGDEVWRIARSGGTRWEGDRGWGMTIEPTGRYSIA